MSSDNSDNFEYLFSDDTSEDDDNDDEFCGSSDSWNHPYKSKIKKMKKHNFKKIKDGLYGSEKNQRKPAIGNNRRRGMNAPFIPQRTISEISDTNHSPAGEPCRFVPYDEIGENVLYPEKYMKNGENGIMTFLPNFQAGNPDHLSYFGFKQSLEQTDLTQISKLTDEELDAAEAEIDAELARIPHIESTETTLIPGFETTLNNAIGINCDVRTFPWAQFGKLAKFDVILMDPPWKVAVKDVTRGVAIRYDQLQVDAISSMGLQEIQTDGYIMMWVIAAQLQNGILMLKKWQYEFVTYLNWIKISKFGKYRPSHGYYMQHNKETLLIGRKGKPRTKCNRETFDSVLIAPRNLRQSHKPVELHKMIEQMFPDQLYLEIFARPHNLRNGWVSLGIELPK